MKRLENKTVIITGGAGGIGSATSKRMIDKGAKVLITDLDEDGLKKVSEEINSPDLYYITADVTAEKQVKVYAEEAKWLSGHVDVFFNNTGTEGEVKPLDEYSLDLYNTVIAVNLHGVYYGLRHVFPFMKGKDGSFIITSSVKGMTGKASVLPYVAGKYTNNGMMRLEVLEGAPNKIRVNTINPEPVDNPMMRSLEEGFTPGETKAAKQYLEKSMPLGRYAKNEDITALALFLASDESSFITGTVNPTEGGMTA